MAISRIERIDGRDGICSEMFSPANSFPPNGTIILRESREYVFFSTNRIQPVRVVVFTGGTCAFDEELKVFFLSTITIKIHCENTVCIL